MNERISLPHYLPIKGMLTHLEDTEQKKGEKNDGGKLTAYCCDLATFGVKSTGRV